MICGNNNTLILVEKKRSKYTKFMKFQKFTENMGIYYGELVIWRFCGLGISRKLVLLLCVMTINLVC